MNYDLAIIGGGPAGYSTALTAAKRGVNTILFERQYLGGVCLNEGCIPTKAFLQSAHLYQDILLASKYGIKVSDSPTPDYKRILARKNKIVRKLTAGVRMDLEQSGVTIVEGTASLAGEEEDRILIQCNGDTYSASHVLLATGSESLIPPIPGLDSANYWTSREALSSKELPESLTIIGGGVIGSEFADFYSSLGIPVTVIEMMPKILGPMDGELSELLRQDMEKQGVTFHLNTQVTEVTATEVLAKAPSGEKISIPYSTLLISVGRRSVTDGLGLETLSITTNRRGIEVNEFLQTSHPRVYAIGDVNGFSQLAHTAIREGEVALEHILHPDSEPMDYNVVPGVVYTHPELAGVGMTEEKLTEEGIDYDVFKIPMSFSGRFVVENEGGNGTFKLLTDKSGKILGCHILGNPAAELIVIFGIAIQQGLHLDDMRKQVYPHPTVGEIIHEALR